MGVNGIRCREAGSAQTATGGAWPTRINDPRLPRRATPRNQKRSETWRARYEGSFAQDFVRGLGAVDFGDRIIIFGACLLLSVLPLIIVLSTYASHRIDDDIATHLGLSAQGDRIVEGLFTASNTSFNLSVLVGLLLSFAGTIAVARSVEVIYERAFEYPPLTRGQGWLRCMVWVAVVAAVCDRRRRHRQGHCVMVRPVRWCSASVEVVGFILFFWWSITLLVGGQGIVARSPPRGDRHRSILGWAGRVRGVLLLHHHRRRQQDLRHDRRDLHARLVVHRHGRSPHPRCGRRCRLAET